MNKIQKIYEKLYHQFGKQGWWPLTKDGTVSRHHAGKPENDRDRLEIIIGAILTQNTNWKNVEKALNALTEKKLMDPKKLLRIKKDALAKTIRSSGYHNQKAERLKIISQFVIDNPISILKKKPIEELRKKLLSIKGIGPETADSIILYAFQKPIFVIDAYTKRIMQRIGYEEKDYQSLQQLFTDNLEHDESIFSEYHALLVEHGKRYCKKEPLCQHCPLLQLCDYGCKVKGLLRK